MLFWQGWKVGFREAAEERRRLSPPAAGADDAKKGRLSKAQFSYIRC
ncbi:hypothetical protein CLJ1_0191 [Pseudomonas paraeruginosa]|nr:hypothetical protein CLJ1_0191 [Pseudomonas aeruginosa]